MADAEHRPAGDHANEGHNSIGRAEHVVPRSDRKIHPAVARLPRLGRRDEVAGDGRDGRKRPGPRRHVVARRCALQGLRAGRTSRTRHLYQPGKTSRPGQRYRFRRPSRTRHLYQPGRASRPSRTRHLYQPGRASRPSRTRHLYQPGRASRPGPCHRFGRFDRAGPLHQPGRAFWPRQCRRFSRSFRPRRRHPRSCRSCRSRQHHGDQGDHQPPVQPPRCNPAGVRPEVLPGQLCGPAWSGPDRRGWGTGIHLAPGGRRVKVIPRWANQGCGGQPHALDDALPQRVRGCPRLVCGNRIPGPPRDAVAARVRPGAPESGRRTRKRQKGQIFRVRSSFSGPLVASGSGPVREAPGPSGGITPL